MGNLIRKYNETSLILRIIIGLVIGTVLGLIIPGLPVIPLFGTIFVGALKAVAPILVFVLVISSLTQGNTGFDNRFGFVIFLYLLSTLLAGVVAVAASFLFPLTVKLAGSADVSAAPSGVGEVLQNLIVSMVGNPVASLGSANYISILFWAVLLGIIFKKVAAKETRKVIADLADAVSMLVSWIIALAPFGIMGLIYETISESGLSIFIDYGKLLLLLVGTMLVVSLILNPILVFLSIHANPYPLVFRCLRESAFMAFFMRSSAANIPVNMALCEKLGLDKGHLFGFHPSGLDDQYGRCSGRNHDYDDDGGQYSGDSCRRCFRHRAFPACHTGSLRHFRRGRRLSAADSDGMLPFRHSAGYSYGNGWRGLHHQCDPGFL